MTLTLTPEIVLLLVIAALLVALWFRFAKLEKAIGEIDTVVRWSNSSLADQATESKTRDSALLKIAQANNAFLAQRAAGGAADVTRKLRQQQAMADAEEAVNVYGYPANDIQEALRAEMDADG